MVILKDEKFAPVFGSWWPYISKFFYAGGFDPIYTFLKSESARGKQIAPLSGDVYKAFQLTPYDKCMMVIVGYCPYHSFYNNLPVADGLAFSCGVTGKLQPSLVSWYDGIEEEFGLIIDREPDLSYLSKQGVLMLNSSLTVEKGKAGSHQELWRPFMKYLMEEVFSYTFTPILFIGKDAQYYERYTMPITHGPVFSIEHPSFAARNFEKWDTKGVFTQINRHLKMTNNIEINWKNEKSDD